MSTALLFAFLLLHPTVQDNCSISGQIADQTGYALPSASLVATSTSGSQSNAVSDGTGQFCFENLSAGSYEVAVIVAGFERTVKNVTVEERAATVDFTLELAHISDGVTVTAMRGDERSSSEFPQLTSTVTREDIMRRTSRILPDILREEAGIHVQQTTVGQGVAYLRGLMGNRVLIMIDGVRFNQSTFRLGPIQYMGTIDPGTIERVEIVKGPGSVLYGSDALGGVINIIRKDRGFTPTTENHGRVLAQFGSADLSSLGRAETTVTGPRFVMGLSGAFGKFNNLRAGGGRYTHSAESRFVTNDPDGTEGRQAPTGYEQYGVNASLRLKLTSDQELSFSFERFHQFDVPRFDQIAGGNGSLRYQFDPQHRDFFSLDWQKTSTGFIDSWRTNFSFQSQPETRLIQSLANGRPGDTIRDWSDTDSYGFMSQAIARAGNRHTLSFGGEGYFDFIDSAIETSNINTGAVTLSRGRFPGDSRYRSYGVFLQDDYRIYDRLHLIAGARGSSYQAKAPDIGAGPLLQALGGASSTAIPTTLDFSAADLNGSAGVVVTAARGLNFAFNVGRAFRAPNINDFGGTGLTGVRFEIPSADLKPESLISYEFSTKLNLNRSFFSVSVFDSEIKDLIDRLPSSINGQTVIGGAQVLARTNFGKGRILGYEAQANIRFSESLIWGNLSHTSGRNISNGDYLGFEAGMPPTQGWLGYKWEPLGRRFWFETFAQLSAKQDRIQGIPISMGGKFNGTTPTGEAADARIGAYRTQAQITSYRQYHGISLTAGTLPNGKRIVPVSEIANTLMFREAPGFATMNVRGGLRLTEMSSVNLLLENLFDRNYRVIGSGVDAPGVNLRVSYEFRF